jgi:hypothetical protein
MRSLERFFVISEILLVTMNSYASATFFELRYSMEKVYFYYGKTKLLQEIENDKKHLSFQ